MLIAAGAMLVLALLFGGAQNDLMLSHIEKQVKTNVIDKDRKTIIITEIKTVKQVQKKYNKQTGKFKKELKKRVANKTTRKTEFDDYFKKVMDYEIESNKLLIPNRLKVQNTLSQEEWTEIINDAKKKIKKDKKSRDNLLKGFKKDLEKFENHISGYIEDKKKRERASDVLQGFSSKMYELAEQILNYEENEETILLDKDATEEELLSLINKDNEYWQHMFDAFTTLHADLSKQSTEKEWKSIAKAINKLY